MFQQPSFEAGVPGSYTASAPPSPTQHHAIEQIHSNPILAAWRVPLSYAQVVAGSHAILPPAENPGNLWGTAVLAFDRDLSAMRVKVYLDVGKHSGFRLNSVTLNLAPAGRVGPPIVSVFESAGKRQATGARVARPLVTKRTIVGETLTNAVQGISSIASLYAAVVRGDVYVSVVGQLVRAEGRVIFRHGILRGQSFPCFEDAGYVSDGEDVPSQ